MKKASAPRLQNNGTKKPLEVKQKASGLCSCCNSLKTCTYARDPKRPILQCEEFDGSAPSSLRRVSPRNVIPSGFEKIPSPGAGEPSPYRGLCSLCEDRLTCIYPKPEGGVWHCEEYR